MAETSYGWTTNGTGDGTSGGYTQAQASIVFDVLAACNAFEGVAPGYLSGLAGSVPGANTARIASGGGLVDGKPYNNTANVDVTIPSASGGGNTRIDRVVLRADWAAQEVRITRIAGTDAGSPTAPAIIQTTGTTYDILLYQALVDTGGTVILTDERTFAAVAITAGLANDIVDDTKVGNRVPQYYRRQGGSSGSWIAQGTTDYVPGSVRMQSGAVAVSIGAADLFQDISITFATAFSNHCQLFFGYGVINEKLYVPVITTQGTTGFTVRLWRPSTAAGAIAGTLYWLAMGPE